jgi:hypothetical protein
VRHPARKGPADSNQKAIAEAIELLVYPRPVMRLNTAGNGVEDLLVPLLRPNGARGPLWARWWLLVECKVPLGAQGDVTPSQYTTAQKEWREMTAGWPRITATSAQNAVDQIRELTSEVIEAGVCRVCGCTDDDCSQCVEKTGEPCSWVSPGLCSACVDDVDENAPPRIPCPRRSGFGDAALACAARVAQTTRGGKDVLSHRKANDMATKKPKARSAKGAKTKGRSSAKGATKRAAKPKARPARPRKAKGAASSDA